MSRVEMNIDTRLYPVEIIHSAINTLPEVVEVSFDPVSETEIRVGLNQSGQAKGNGYDAELRRLLQRALISARVADYAFRRAQPIRTYLAQTAFSITSQNQQTIEEFTAGLVQQREQEHAGAASTRQLQPADKPDGDESSCDEVDWVETENGSRWRLDQESGEVVMSIDTSSYVLPEVLWAAHEMGATCPCSVLNRSDHQISVTMEPQGEAPEQQAASFDRWLVTAREHLR